MESRGAGAPAAFPSYSGFTCQAADSDCADDDVALAAPATRLSECEWALVLSCCGRDSLLCLPPCSRAVHHLVSASEDWAWTARFAEEVDHHRGHVPTCVLENGDPVLVPDFPAEKIGPKGACRLHRFLARQCLPTLPDALRQAAERDHRQLIYLLLAALADPNVQADHGAYGVGFTQVGAFPLHVAAKQSHVGALAALVTARALVDVADHNGRTALMVASASGKTASAEWLIGHGVSLDSVSDYGYTALHYAAQLPRAAMVELLLEARASPGCQDQGGQTPLHLVCHSVPRGHRDVQREAGQMVGNVPHPSSYGDEYCYCRNDSQGYDSSANYEGQQEQLVMRAAAALLRHGAGPGTPDLQGNTPSGMLRRKCRPEWEHWFSGVAAGKATASRGPGSTAGETMMDDRPTSFATVSATALAPRGSQSAPPGCCCLSWLRPSLA